MKKTIKPNLDEINNDINSYYLKKLQRQDISLETLKIIKFHTTKYRNILEILSDENKSNFEKVTEWLGIETIYNGLVGIKITTKNRLDFTLDNPDYLVYLDKKENGEDVSISDFPGLQESIDEYNKQVKEIFPEEEFYKELLEIEKQRYLGNYEIITYL